MQSKPIANAIALRGYPPISRGRRSMKGGAALPISLSSPRPRATSGDSSKVLAARVLSFHEWSRSSATQHVLCHRRARSVDHQTSDPEAALRWVARRVAIDPRQSRHIAVIRRLTGNRPRATPCPIQPAPASSSKKSAPSPPRPPRSKMQIAALAPAPAPLPSSHPTPAPLSLHRLSLVRRPRNRALPHTSIRERCRSRRCSPLSSSRRVRIGKIDYRRARQRNPCARGFVSPAALRSKTIRPYGPGIDALSNSTPPRVRLCCATNSAHSFGARQRRNELRIGRHCSTAWCAYRTLSGSNAPLAISG